MPQQDTTIQAPKLVADPTTDHQLVTGPDGKQYRFGKKWNQQQINNYFTRKGIKAPAKAPTTTTSNDGMSGMGAGIPPSAVLDTFRSLPTAVKEYTATGMPSALGIAGSIAGGGKGPLAAAGAGIGGFVGEDIRQMIMRPILLARGQEDMGAMQSLSNMAVEGGKQAALQYGGEKAGEYLFKTLAKVIPHATVKGTIPMLPSDLKPGSKMTRYVEDLLTNLFPSAPTMEKFINAQSAAAEKKADLLAKGFSRFTGTDEELGNLIQKTMKKEDDLYVEQLDKLRKTMPKGKQTPQFVKANTALGQEYHALFENKLMQAITKEQNPELITAMLGSETKAGLENTRRMMDFLHEKYPDIVGKIQSRFMRNIINDTMTGAKDPTIREITNRFSGKSFTSTLNSIGQEKLKTIYGEQGYKSIQRFEKLVSHIDRTTGNGTGRFYNLMLALNPIRNLSPKAMRNLGVQAFVINRMAKIITSEEGVGLYENWIKASAAQAPKLMEAARAELVKYNERSDQEMDIENKEIDDQTQANRDAINKLDIKEQERVGRK